jgi:hypothetical protein
MRRGRRRLVRAEAGKGCAGRVSHRHELAHPALLRQRLHHERSLLQSSHQQVGAWGHR